MQNRLLIRSLLLFLITTCFALALQSSTPSKLNNVSSPQVIRDKRFFFKKKSPGFIRTLFSVVYELEVSTTTVSSDPNATTTEAPYKITRSEFNRILSRNLRGLVRLFNIEMQDALKASEKNIAEYRKNASLEVSKFL